MSCPKCGDGKLFKKKGLFIYKKILDMHEKCEVCNFKFEIEPGFWLGSLWTSYPIIILIELPFLMLAVFSVDISPWVSFGLMLIAFFFVPVIRNKRYAYNFHRKFNKRYVTGIKKRRLNDAHEL